MPSALLASMFVVSTCFWADVSGQETRPARTEDYRYYVAAMAAAATHLELHETRAARHWLDEAPEEHRGWEWSYLEAMADRSAGTFTAHSEAVVDLEVSPDGKALAVAAGDGVGLWDLHTVTRTGTLAGHAGKTWNVRFSPDGERLATVASDGTLRVWDRAIGAELLRVEEIGAGVAGVAWRPDGAELATVSWTRDPERGVLGILGIWDPATGESRHRLEHGIKPIASVNYSPDGSRLYVGTWDFDVGVYDARTWQPITRLVPPDDGVYKAVRESRPSPDGTRLAAAHEDGAVRVWDPASGRLLHVLHRQAEGLRLAQHDIVWFADGRRLAAASTDLTVRLWDAADGEHLATLHGHAASVTALALTPDGRTLWSGDAAGTVKRWDLVAQAPERSRWTLPGVAYGVAVNLDGRRVAAAGWGGWVALFELASGREVVRWQGHDVSGVRVAWHPAGDLLATTGNDGRVKVWDTGETPPAPVFEKSVEIQSPAVAFSPDGAYLASPSTGPALVVWSVPEGREVARLDDGVLFSDAEWHPRKALLAVAGQDGVVRLWDPAADRVLARLEGHGDGGLQAAFSADGSRLAAASASGSIRIWQLDPPRLLHEMRMASGGQLAVAFSPDGRRLATGGRDDRVHLWDPAAGTHLLEVRFSEAIWDLAWSPDGRRLLVVPLDGTLRVLESHRP